MRWPSSVHPVVPGSAQAAAWPRDGGGVDTALDAGDARSDIGDALACVIPQTTSSRPASTADSSAARLPGDMARNLTAGNLHVGRV
ncbi:hypothetical protein GCM10010341_66620 [Streptomyces noursei]|nr:hypothetical protein GCM10010341_66620 [Streptomyces noursei]